MHYDHRLNRFLKHGRIIRSPRMNRYGRKAFQPAFWKLKPESRFLKRIGKVWW